VRDDELDKLDDLYHKAAKHVLKAARSLKDVLDAQHNHWDLLKIASNDLAENILKKDLRTTTLSAFHDLVAAEDKRVTVAEAAIVKQKTIDDAQAETQEGSLLLSSIHRRYDAHLAQNPRELALVTELDLISNLNQVILPRVLVAAKGLEDQSNIVKSTFGQIKDIQLTSAPNPKVGLIQDLLLAQDRNVKVTQSVSCVSLLDKTKVTLDPVPISVTYQNVPRLTFSVGPVLSTLNKRQIGTSLVKTGTDDKGAATLKTTIAVTDQAAAQVVPFSFLNFKLYDRPWASRTFTFNLSGGVGVNPNSGTKEPEFFSGVAFGLDRMLVHLGMHTGRLQQLGGGFQIGDTVPDKTSGLPINRSYENRFAVALSFRIAP
jgi:hypothetical protein